MAAATSSMCLSYIEAFPVDGSTLLSCLVVFDCSATFRALTWSPGSLPLVRNSLNSLTAGSRCSTGVMLWGASRWLHNTWVVTQSWETGFQPQCFLPFYIRHKDHWNLHYGVLVVGRQHIWFGLSPLRLEIFTLGDFRTLLLELYSLVQCPAKILEPFSF